MTIVSERDRGLYDAMNKGLGLAKGDYVIFLNAGDAFHNPNTLQLIADTVMDNDYPGIVYGQTQIVDASRRRLGDRHLKAPSILTLDSFKDGMVVCHQAFIVLRKLVDNYDTRYRYSADFEWCIRCLQRSHRNCYIDRILIDYLSEGVTTATIKPPFGNASKSCAIISESSLLSYAMSNFLSAISKGKSKGKTFDRCL